MRTNLIIVTLLFGIQLCTAQTPDSTTKGFLHFTIGAPLSQFEHEVYLIPDQPPHLHPRYYTCNKYTYSVSGIVFKQIIVSFDSLDQLNEVTVTNFYNGLPYQPSAKKGKKDFIVLRNNLTAAWNREGEYRILYEKGDTQHDEYRWQNDTATLLLQRYQIGNRKTLTLSIFNKNYNWPRKNIIPQAPPEL